MTNKPNIHIHDASTGVVDEREMTDDEYSALLATGWTLESPQETKPE